MARSALAILFLLAATLMVPPQASIAQGCQLDALGPWSEVAGAGPQRIEVGGGGFQHMDLYPRAGVRSVSWIVKPHQFTIYSGFGSAWEGNGAICSEQNYDYVADAARYAQGRLSGRGHSGVIAEFLPNNGEIRVLHNISCLPWSEVASLIQTNVAAMASTANMSIIDMTDGCGSPSSTFSAVAAPPVQTYQAPAYQAQRYEDYSGYGYEPVQRLTTTYPAHQQPSYPYEPRHHYQPGYQYQPSYPSYPQGGGQGCSQAARYDRHLSSSTLGHPGYFNHTNSWVVINGWSNERGYSQGSFKLLLRPGENPGLLIGGAYYVWPQGCEQEAITGYNSNSLPPMDLGTLRSLGLARY